MLADLSRAGALPPPPPAPPGRGAGAGRAVDVVRTTPACGDELRLRLVTDPDGRVAAAGAEHLGCALSAAGAALAVREAVGAGPSALAAAVARAVAVTTATGAEAAPDWDADGDLAAFAGTGAHPGRVGCALLGWRALADAVRLADQDHDHHDPSHPMAPPPEDR